MRKPFVKYLAVSLLVTVTLLGLTTQRAAAISNILPEATTQGDIPTLIIGRLADGNSIGAQDTSVKLIYAAKPDVVKVFDGPYCASSTYDNHTGSANSPCSSGSLNGEVYFDFQALNNDTGAVGPVIRVLGSTMAAAGGVNGNYTVNLQNLAGVAPSTDGKWFVKVHVSWAKPNATSCTKDSSISSTCQTGSNLFRLSLTRLTDYITYAVTNADNSPLAVITDFPGAATYADYSFEFAPPCDATGAQLNQPLKWQDADYGENNQTGTIYWDLYDDSAAGGPKKVLHAQDAALGGQASVRQQAFTFVATHKYRWVWGHVQHNNGVILSFPFDSYNYLRPCPSTTPPPTTPPPTTPPPTTPPPTTPPPTPPPTTPPPPPEVGDPILTKPFFSIKGGDTVAGPGMSLGGEECAIPANNKAGLVGWNGGAASVYAGAGTQFAAFVLNHLQEFATGQGSAFAPSGLSFANTIDAMIDKPAGLYGGSFAGGNKCSPDYFAAAANVQTGSKLLSALPDFPVGGNVANATTQTYYVDGDLYIDSNVKFSGNYAAIDRIPSFSVVVQGNIYIDHNVSQLDGTYIAQPTSKASSDGIIYTCATDNIPPFTPLPLDRNLRDTCFNSLVVNGSLNARQIHLLRTAGNLTDNPALPAETINYIPELWLTTKPNSDGGGTGSASDPTKYDSITSLPPVL